MYFFQNCSLFCAFGAVDTLCYFPISRRKPIIKPKSTGTVDSQSVITQPRAAWNVTGRTRINATTWVSQVKQIYPARYRVSVWAASQLGHVLARVYDNKARVSASKARAGRCWQIWHEYTVPWERAPGWPCYHSMSSTCVNRCKLTLNLNRQGLLVAAPPDKLHL